ncbi:MAG TPA: hypothetical protein VHH73_13180 [Verrucomicrobiae bacterium]|nr:hypothetical protein [Verrucomicrobiae bacterium]
MKTNSRLLTFAALCGAVSFASAGDITGKVTLKGTPPPEKELTPLKNDPTCGPRFKEVNNGAVPMTRFYMADSSGGLADVVVSITGLSGKSTGDSAKPLLIDQTGCEYTPYVSAVQTKQTINVRNSDPVLHNVHVLPTADGNKESNKAQLPKTADIPYSFSAPEEFLKFKCDVHPWMFAYVTVADHPYIAVTGKDGSFTIANVPPGKYKLQAAHRKGGVVTQEIEVTGGGAKADFSIEAK